MNNDYYRTSDFLTKTAKYNYAKNRYRKLKAKRLTSRVAPGPYNPIYRNKNGSLVKVPIEMKYAYGLIKSQPIVPAIGYYSWMMNTVPGGVGPYDRIGYQVAFHKLHFQCIVVGRPFYNVAMADAKTARQVRIIILLDKRPNGLGFTLTDVFQNGGSPSDALFSYKAVKNADRFVFLRDELLPMPTQPIEVASTTMSLGETRLTYETTINFRKPLVTKYQDMTINTASIMQNSLSVIVMDGGVSGDYHVTSFSAKTELRYTDV